LEIFARSLAVAFLPFIFVHKRIWRMRLKSAKTIYEVFCVSDKLQNAIFVLTKIQEILILCKNVEAAHDTLFLFRFR